MDRVYFERKDTLLKFFSNIRKDSNLSWSMLAKKIDTTRSMLDNYRKGNLCMPANRFSKLIELINSLEARNLFLFLAKTKEKNWGQVKGGKNAYKINKLAFEEGRKKARKNIVKYEFDINMPLSEELCEFVGVIIGDGCTNKYRSMYQTQIAGDKVLDKKYYFNNLFIICKNLFGISPHVVVRPKGLYVNLYSKRVFELLTKRFKIPAGVKCYSVKIPEEIISAPKIMLKFVLRGMFNTDGGVGLDKRKTYKKPYIRINYTSASFDLIEQVHSALSKYNLPHSIHNVNYNRAKQIQINGEKNVKLFLKEIGFSNPRHLTKVHYLL